MKKYLGLLIIPWMKKKTNQYTSHDVQNECLKIYKINDPIIIRALSQKICEP